MKAVVQLRGEVNQSEGVRDTLESGVDRHCASYHSPRCKPPGLGTPRSLRAGPMLEPARDPAPHVDAPGAGEELEQRLRHIVGKLRRFQGTDQEVEFTVEDGILSVLQARSAMTGTDQPADRFVDPGEAATRGLGIRGGAFRGLAAFDEADRARLAAVDLHGRDDVDGVLMILDNPTPEDIPMILSAHGLLTTKGGSTSHAAVAAHGIDDRDFSAVMSATGLSVDAAHRVARIVDEQERVLHTIRSGDVVSIHGTTGAVHIGSHRVEGRG